ncbi:diaminobutyrate acetyltransferase [Streptomyces candidus]|uniref:L-2,4-diaminobutyric acid acetyltransferase n=1 Tax=Streptomyces candidus TaxID=67283 RepID=A0A7X0LSF8_9ACTN|nr:diaminobutyrate acetyltransferase [Streptomyces candidus]MBB6439215.1 L-2,4-diaminobutyric acid acetyltransferase [Streptomyces candidus]GHH55328.1 L-2,4-diaminobutyric acid acetyltransferase [Streptomyces candidus]
MTAAQADLPTEHLMSRDNLQIDSPRVEDGAAIWRIARDSQVLDLNSSYSYLLWCRDFAATSVVARDRPNGEPIAFITGYVRPERPETLVVWQVAVDDAHRGRGLAGTLLDALTVKVAASHGVTTVETTVTPDNVPSDRLFTSYAERRGASLNREVLFDGGLFPHEAGGDAHLPEVLYRISPVAA